MYQKFITTTFFVVEIIVSFEVFIEDILFFLQLDVLSFKKIK